MATKERKGEPFSIRLSESTDRLVAAEAKRTKRSKSSVVESLAEEASRVRRFPGIGFHGDDFSREAWVIGTGLDVWEIIQMTQEFDSDEALIRDTQLTERHLQLARAYHAEFPVEIDDAISENTRPVEEWRALYPFLVQG